MRERLRCEFALLRYVPDVVKGEFANIGVLLQEESGRATVRFTRDWSHVRCLDPEADTELLESLEAEFSAQLDQGPDPNAQVKPLLQTLGDTLSNSVQMTALQGTLAESLPAAMEQLLRMYVEPTKRPAARRKESGRTLIAGRIRAEFERAGVWSLLRKKIPASQYTGPGDPLKIDCGYRNGSCGCFRLFRWKAMRKLPRDWRTRPAACARA